MCDMDGAIVIWRLFLCDMLDMNDSNVWHISFLYVTRLIVGARKHPFSFDAAALFRPHFRYDSSHIYENEMSHIWTGHVTQANKLCHMYERVLSHIWKYHVWNTNKTWHTNEWVISHIWLSHVTRNNLSYDTHQSVMARPWFRRAALIKESCHMAPLVSMSHVTQVSHVMYNTAIRHGTHMSDTSYQVSYHVSYTCYGVASISRLLKIIGLFCKEPYKRDDILQKRPMFLGSLLIVATPYEVSWHTYE